MVLAPFGAALLVSVVAVVLLIPRLNRAGIVGRDMHKLRKPPVAEMGGLAIVAGTGVGISVALAMMSFFGDVQLIVKPDVHMASIDHVSNPTPK